MTTPADTDSSTNSITATATTNPAASPITKIGTEVFGLRVISGYLHATDPDRIFLRQLYPGKPANIGHLATTLAAAEPDAAQLTINANRAAEWTDRDRTALASFVLTRYTDRIANGGITLEGQG